MGHTNPTERNNRNNRNNPNSSNEEKNVGGRIKVAAICIGLILLIAASFKLQMELNSLRDEYNELKAEADAVRIERDRLKEQYEQSENDPDEYLAQKAKDEGYYDPDSQRVLNDMPDT